MASACARYSRSHRASENRSRGSAGGTSTIETSGAEAANLATAARMRWAGLQHSWSGRSEPWNDSSQRRLPSG
eukprot:scaffold3972_cov95-Isochrysis_galbana.AAC.4